MSGRTSHSTSLPDPSGPFDDRFVDRLTDEGKKILAEHERSNGKPAFSQSRCTAAVAEALDSEARRQRPATAQERRPGARRSRRHDLRPLARRPRGS